MLTLVSPRTYFLFLLVSSAGFAATQDAIRFEPNRGQADPDCRFVLRTGGALVLVGDSQVTFWSRSAGENVHFQLQFEGANPGAKWDSLEPHAGATTYVVGNRPEAWIHDVPHYGRIVRRNLYAGIDLVLYGAGDQLEYDLVLHPRADVRRVRMRFSGEQKLSIGENGDLIAATVAGSLVEHRPVLYQLAADGARRPVDGGWRLLGEHTASFQVGRHEKSLPLVIDPVVIAATYLGAGKDYKIVAADPRNAVVGTTLSANSRGSSGMPRRGSDIFIYNPVTEATTIIGGSGEDVATCAKITGTFVAIGGYTNSRDFPVSSQYYGPQSSPLATQPQFGGGNWDGFLVLTQVQYSVPYLATYLGGSGDDRVLGIDNFNYGMAAVGSTTSADFPVVSAWQNSPGGGTDGFLTVINGQGLIPLSSYLGGSGDDEALAVSISASGTNVFAAGTTTSSDWKTPSGWSGTRRGPSDGFLLHLSSNTSFTQLQFQQGSYFGGSGDDRVTALAALPNGNLAAAGTTSSSDLVFSNAMQSSFGGGGSDAFLSVFSGDLQTVAAGTYLGGSGEEQLLALATNGFNEVLVGGWTNSANFPVAGTALSQCGIGSDQGFVAHLDAGLQPIYSTCYGEAQDHRITSVLSDGSQNDFIGGYTTSFYRPVPGVAHPAAGGVDGFYATLSVPAIHALDVTVGKDLTAPLLATLGDSGNYAGTPLTATSGDSTKVLIAVQPDDPGAGSATLQSSYDAAYVTRRFLIDCLTDNATIPVTLSAPGYPSRSVNVRCVPSGLYVNPAGFGVTNGSGAIGVLPAAIDPATQQPIAFQNPRGGLSPIDIQVVNTNPALTFSPTSLTIDQYSNLAQSSNYGPPVLFQFQSSGVASADVTFTSSSPFLFTPSNVAHIASAPLTLNLYLPPAARDLRSPIGAYYFTTQPSGTVPITFTSSDPSKVLLATSPTAPGQAAVTLNYTSQNIQVNAYLEVLDDSGSVSITVSAPGTAPTTMPVTFSAIRAGFFFNGYPATQTSAVVGSPLSVQVQAFVGQPPASGASTPQYWLRPGAAPLTARLSSSAPGVVTDSTGNNAVTLATPGGMLQAASVNLQAQSAGSATYSLQPVSAHVNAAWPLSVTVVSSNLSVKTVPVGYNLTAPMTVMIGGFPSNGTASVVLTVSDPAKALLAPDVITPGQPSIGLSMNYWSMTFYLQALAGAGTVDILATSPGYGSYKTTVRLVPSGFLWMPSAITLPSAYSSAASVGPVALEPGSRTVLGNQIIRPGLSGSLILQVADSTVATLKQATIPLSAFNSGFQTVTPVMANGGTTQVAIVQPPGFVAPAGSGPLQLTMTPPSVYLQPATIAVNAQATLGFSLANWPAGTALPPVTITSSDPSKLLFSAGSSTVGSATVTVTPSGPNSYPQYSVYMNALDGPADVPITASGPGLTTVKSVIPIQAMGLGLSGYNGSSIAVNVQSPVSLNLNPEAISASGTVSGNMTLRPGLPSIPVTINSSNPSVATVTNSPILNSLTNTSPFSLQPLSPGQTTLTVSVPPGYRNAPPGSGRTLQVTVNPTSFQMSDITIGEDLEVVSTLNLTNGGFSIAADVDVTLVSANPSALLLSAIASAPGASTLTVHFVRGSSTYANVYFQALEQTGKFSVAISAPGYTSTAANVTVVPTGFLLNSGPITLQNSPTTIRVTPQPVGVSTNYAYVQFRPGITGPTISAASSNPAVATISPASAVWPAGAQSLNFAVTPVSAGTASLTFGVPAPYTAPPALGVTVQGGAFNIYQSSLTVGSNLQDVVTLFSLPSGLSVSVTSSDPTRVLVSASPTVAGQASAVIKGQGPQNTVVYVQALAGSGTASLTFSAAGYQNASITVNLAPVAVELTTPSNLSTLTPLSAPLAFQAKLDTFTSGYSTSAPVLRPGAAPVSVQAAFSGTAIGTLSPSQITFNPGDSTQPFSFQATTPGTSLLTLSVPAGFADPVALRQQLLTVVPASVNFANPLSVGYDLQRPNYIALASPVGSALNFTLTSSDPSRLLLANQANPNGVSSVVVTIAANQSSSTSFSLLGLASSGTVALNVSAPGLSQSPTVTLLPSGFILGSTPGTVGVNAPLTLTVLPEALDAQTFAPLGNFSLRPGIAPISTAIASSNGAVIASPISILLSGGNSQNSVNVLPRVAGTTTLSLQAPPGFQAPSSGASITLTAQ
jgi:hypothetical protein